MKLKLYFKKTWLEIIMAIILASLGVYGLVKTILNFSIISLIISLAMLIIGIFFGYRYGKEDYSTEIIKVEKFDVIEQ